MQIYLTVKDNVVELSHIQHPTLASDGSKPSDALQNKHLRKASDGLEPSDAISDYASLTD